LFQQHGDFLIWHSDDPLITERLEEIPLLAHSYPFSLNRSLQPGCFVRGDEVLFSDGCLTKTIWRIHQDRFLRGEHNLKNILAAVTASILLKVDTEAIGEGISTFKGLEHRLEYVGEFRGIHFYNDSISTIPEACIEAVRSIPGVDTLIAGGFDRGIPYDSLAAFLLDSQVRTLVFIGAAGRRIGEAMEAIQQKRGRNDHTQKIFYINRFDDLREIVFRETRKDHACLLSPAAASYDEFNNFEERGKRFRLLVQK
jgi:UDP-N-acetylmuramoylalanine--D-glutamate ligase